MGPSAQVTQDAPGSCVGEQSTPCITLATISTELREPWVALDLNAPALILSEMPVEYVELMQGQQINEFFYEGDAEPTASSPSLGGACLRMSDGDAGASGLHCVPVASAVQERPSP